MKEFYYQIKGKGKEVSIFGTAWEFPPIFSGKVSADDRDKAKKAVEELYGRQFPTRVLIKDLRSNEFLLRLKEIEENDHHIKRLFEVQTCKKCQRQFTVIEKYNDVNCKGKGSEFCSDECKEESRVIEQFIRNENEVMNGRRLPIIYKITNANCFPVQVYIGKTTQEFTLRWYQHFFQTGSTKFHEAIKQSQLTDWTFEVIEIVKIPNTVTAVGEIENIILERERFWIAHYNSIGNGYNTKQ